MDKEKRSIIVREIEQWRRSKLLPEHYCDFLLNLYLDNPGDRQGQVMGVSSNSIKNSNWKIWFLSFAVIALITYVVIHFNSFSFPMQIMSAALFVTACYGAGMAMRRKMPAISYALAGLGSIALLGAGFYLLRLHGLDDPVLSFSYVAFCSFVWILIGVISRMGLFHFCGWIGLALVYAALLHTLTELDLLGAQLGWLPLCAVFGWLGWLLHRVSKSTGAVLLLVSFSLWWVPEAYSLYAGLADAALLQLLFLGKLAVAAAVLFGLRKKWIEWVV